MQKEELGNLWVSRDFCGNGGRNDYHYVLANIRGTWFLYLIAWDYWPRKKVTGKFRKDVVLESIFSRTILKGEELRNLKNNSFNNNYIHRNTILKLMKEIENEIAFNL